MKALATVLSVLVLTAILFGQNAPGNNKINVLIITGDDVPAHKWKETTPVMRKALEDSGRFEVRVSEEPAVLATDALSKYDVILLNYRDGRGRTPGMKAQENLHKFVASGKGLVAIHFSVAALRDMKEYRDLMGRVWVGKVSGHGPKGKFTVNVASGDHPIVQGIEDFEIDDELYAKLEGEKELNVLLTAYSDWSKRVEPMAWTHEFEKGRVFNTVLGHDAVARGHASFKKLLVQGTEWAATGKVSK